MPPAAVSHARVCARAHACLQVSSEPGMRYNMPLTNALVLYVGTQAIGHIHSKGLTPSMSTIAHSSHMDIFQNLAVDLDTEGTHGYPLHTPRSPTPLPPTPYPHIRSKGLTPSMSTIAHSSHMDIFQNLAVDLDMEGTHGYPLPPHPQQGPDAQHQHHRTPTPRSR